MRRAPALTAEQKLWIDRRYPADNNCRATTRDFNWAWAGVRGWDVAHTTVQRYLRTRVGQVGADGPQQVEVGPQQVTKKWAPSARCGIVIALALVMILLGFALMYWPKVIIL